MIQFQNKSYENKTRKENNLYNPIQNRIINPFNQNFDNLDQNSPSKILYSLLGMETPSATPNMISINDNIIRYKRTSRRFGNEGF